MYEIVHLGNGKSKAVGNCVFTKTSYETAPFVTRHYKEWKRYGVAIQDTGLIDLSSEDREFLISGTTPEFWKLVKDTE